MTVPAFIRVALVLSASVLAAACGNGAAATTEPPDLTVSHGCGYGFAIGDEEQTTGLVLSYTDFEAASRGDVDGEYVLPDDVWDSDLSFGRDLFSNWCDDVVEPGEPEVVIDTVVEVTGFLEISSLPEPGTCGLAEATLFDATYETPDGSVSLGDVALRNDSWGCFAG